MTSQPKIQQADLPNGKQNLLYKNCITTKFPNVYCTVLCACLHEIEGNKYTVHEHQVIMHTGTFLQISLDGWKIAQLFGREDMQ